MAKFINARFGRGNNVRGYNKRLSNNSFGMKRRQQFGFPKRNEPLAFGSRLRGMIRGGGSGRPLPINIFRKRGSFLAKKKFRRFQRKDNSLNKGGEKGQEFRRKSKRNLKEEELDRDMQKYWKNNDEKTLQVHLDNELESYMNTTSPVNNAQNQNQQGEASQQEDNVSAKE